jgi:hypothetical protein
MQFSSIKAILGLFSLLALLRFGTAAPASTDNTLNTSPIDTRQESNGIYYGDLCNPKDPMAVWFPKKCWLGLYQKKNTSDFWTGGNTFTWDTTLYIFRTNCDIIGYIPNAGNLEGRWVSMDSQLKYTVDVQTVNQVPQFNYAGRSYQGDNADTYSVNWTKNDSGIEVTIWKLLFDC